MATFNQLQRSAYADLVRRLFGSDIVIDGISPEFLANIQLEDGGAAEWQYLKQYHHWSLRNNVGAGGVGVFGGTLIQNVGIGVLIVMFVQNVNNAVSGAVVTGPRAGAFPANYGAVSRTAAVASDGRFGPPAAATEVTNGNVGVATKSLGGSSAGLPGLQISVASVPLMMPNFFRVLMPNQWLLIENDTQNAQHNINVTGMYRDSTRPEETQA